MPVARLCLDAEQDGIITSGVMLQRGDKFFRVHRDDPVIGIGGGDENRRIFNAGLYVVQRRVGIEGFELFGDFRASIFGYPVSTDGEFVEAEHIGDGDD